MMHAARIILILCLAGFSLAATPAPPGGRDFVLFYSNNVQGETEPCG